MNWERLKSFFQVARAGSVTNAATQMNISQSALSRSILQLEHELKTSLFQRLPHGLELTPQGKDLYSITTRMFNQAESVEFLFDQEKNEPEGFLRITTTIALASMWLPSYTLGFLAKYPDMRLIIVSDDYYFGLDHRQADVSIRTLITHQTELIQEYLLTFKPKLYASPEYLERFGEPKKIEDLDHHRLIIYNDDHLHPYENMNWVLRAGKKKGKERKPFLSINLGPGLMRMAEQGVGIVAISDQYITATGSSLVRILPEWEGPGTKIYYSYPKQMKGYKRIEIFGQYLREVLNSKDDENGTELKGLTA